MFKKSDACSALRSRSPARDFGASRGGCPWRDRHFLLFEIGVNECFRPTHQPQQFLTSVYVKIASEVRDLVGSWSCRLSQLAWSCLSWHRQLWPSSLASSYTSSPTHQLWSWVQHRAQFQRWCRSVRVRLIHYFGESHENLRFLRCQSELALPLSAP